MYLIVILLSSWTTFATATCYSRNGTEITNIAYQPCSTDKTRDSVCCGTNHDGAGETNVANDICETNGLCQNWAGQVGNEQPPKLWWRQGCTDPTWESPYCLKNVCNFDLWKNDNAPVHSCSGGKWCCGVENCCSISASLFELAATVGPTSTSISLTPTSAPAITTSASTSQPTSQSSSNPLSNTVPAPSNTNLPATSTGFPTAAKIGVGIGVPLLVVLLAIIGFLSWKLKKRGVQKLPAEMYSGLDTRKVGDDIVYAHIAPPVELDGNHLPAESGGTPRAELTGDEGAIWNAGNLRRKLSA